MNPDAEFEAMSKFVKADRRFRSFLYLVVALCFVAFIFLLIEVRTANERTQQEIIKKIDSIEAKYLQPPTDSSVSGEGQSAVVPNRKSYESYSLPNNTPEGQTKQRDISQDDTDTSAGNPLPEPFDEPLQPRKLIDLNLELLPRTNNLLNRIGL